MCGPLAVACPLKSNNPIEKWISRSLYHLGRLTTYMILGAAAGFFSHLVYLAGVQRIISTAVGLIIIVISFSGLAGLKNKGGSIIFRYFTLLKKPFQIFFKKISFFSVYMLGLLNGLIPCGMVYVAVGSALAVGAQFHTVLFMLAFGIGTIPLLALSISGFNYFHQKMGMSKRWVYPVMTCIIGLWLILRGLNIGIPWLSPDLLPWLHSGSDCG